MSCFYPIRAFRVPFHCEGRTTYEIVFDESKSRGNGVPLFLPCGQCDGCRLERARQWAVRCMHEASLYERNCFITLTYNDAHLPAYSDLCYSDFQLFMKRLRRRYVYTVKPGFYGPERRVRFFMCGEYGDDHSRPHFHCCLFNLDFDDRVYFKTGSSGERLYTSAELDSLWCAKGGDSLGFATVGALTFDSAGYVARYTLKKRASSDLDYQVVDMESGEVILREREFTRMSLKPGIGTDFYRRWLSDIFPRDVCVVAGKEMKPPRFYARKYAAEHPVEYEELAWFRQQRALEKQEDNTPERLEVKEKVLQASMKFLKRELS